MAVSTVQEIILFYLQNWIYARAEFEAFPSW